MKNSLVQKIAVVGNAAGGKTRMSLRLSQLYALPVTHVDSIQFVAGMTVRPYPETCKLLLQITEGESWIIDGYGPLDLIESRFLAADWVVFIDLPIWLHFWWCAKRQFKNLWSPRAELPAGCNEATVAHTLKLYRTMWSMHKKMRPELLRIFNRENLRRKVIYVRSFQQWKDLYKNGIPFAS